ncbi:ABC transporter ATP-binding protein [Frigidibacter sp. MR17.14]|uniref:ABC transporter ATP-binding protein n=1 Tax=Frigidibacter sp. MR17.14 TaxID=3126509 RepID=UPI003013129A
MTRTHENRLLEIEDLQLGFDGAQGLLPALRGVSVHLDRGELVALVGQSGSGKSVTGLTVLRLLGANARIAKGAIRFDGQDLLSFSERQMRGIRGGRIAMVFQNAKASLNPIRRVGDTLADIVLAHDTTGLSRKQALQKVVGLMAQIGIALPEERARAYPSELSGGMCQRIGIAAALASDPELIIADEPTSALDVTTQQLVMDTLTEAARARGVAVIFITHDLALASEYCDRAVVMNAGRIVEEGPADRVFTDPQHPYTRALLDALPYGKTDASELRPMTWTDPEDSAPGAEGPRS